MNFGDQSFDFSSLDLCDPMLGNEFLLQDADANIALHGLHDLLDLDRPNQVFAEHTEGKHTVEYDLHTHTEACKEGCNTSVKSSHAHSRTSSELGSSEDIQSRKSDRGAPTHTILEDVKFSVPPRDFVDESRLSRNNTITSVQTSSRLPMDQTGNNSPPPSNLIPLPTTKVSPASFTLSLKEFQSHGQSYKEHGGMHMTNPKPTEAMPLSTILSPDNHVQTPIIPPNLGSQHLMYIQPSEILSSPKSQITESTPCAVNWNTATAPFHLIRRESGLSTFSGSFNTSQGHEGSSRPEGAIQPKLRYSEGASASHYCHICGRASNTAQLAACANVRIGLCRKTLCEKCLLVHQRELFEWAKEKDTSWTCTHCRGVCPKRARCHQYQRNNMRRRLKNGVEGTKEKKSTGKRENWTVEGKVDSNKVRLGVEGVLLKKNSSRSRQTKFVHPEATKAEGSDEISPTGISSGAFGSH